MTITEMPGIFAYLGLLLLSGYATIAWLRSDQSALETFGLSACLGPAVAAFLLIAFSMLGLRPSIAEMCGLALLAGASLVLCRFVRGAKATSASPPCRHSIGWGAVALLLVVYSTIFVVKDAFFSPVGSWDAFSLWQLKAKVLARQPMIPRPDYFYDVNLSYSHLRYPVLVPMISAGAMAAAGNRDGIGKPPFALMYVGMIALLFASMRRTHGRLIASVATMIFATLPPYTYFAGAGTAELAITVFYAGSLVCLLRWLDRQESADLLLTALFSTAAAWTKNEGLAMAAINGLIVLLFTPRPLQRRHLAATLGFAVMVVAMYLPWAIYSHDFPRTDEDYPLHLTAATILANRDRLPLIFHAYFSEATNLQRWSGLWIVLALTAMLCLHDLARRPILALWTAMILQIAAVTLAYEISIIPPADLIPQTIERLTLQLTPAATLLIAWQWRASVYAEA
ncbi:MAG TPA: glycosyltransferase family 39 protein [Tepidisphaeraceae bacterium]|nr:glycosyltransferase family 39 protein [Tepidisphaeraceae bacterium]